MEHLKKHTRKYHIFSVLAIILAVIGCIYAFKGNYPYDYISGIFFGLTILCGVMPAYEDGRIRFVPVELAIGIAFIVFSLIKLI